MSAEARMRRITGSLLMAGLALSCSEQLTRESEYLGPLTSATGLCDNHVGTTQNVWRHWDCNTNVYLNVSSLSSGDRAAITSATQAWNSLLYNRYPQLPRFTTDAAVFPKHYTISVTATAAGMTTWCGGVSPAGSGRPTSLTVGTTASGNQCGTPFDVALHEMSHIAGFGADWHTPGSTTLTHCAVALTTGFVGNVNTNGRPCRWEVEIMLALYGIRSGPPSSSKHIITTLLSPSGPTTLQVPNSGTLGYAYYVFDGSNGLFCGKTSRQMCEADDAIQPMTGSLQWASSAPAVATVSSPGAQTTVTAVSAGSTTITATPQAITAYEIGTGSKGVRSFTVTAAPPPPPPPPDASIVGNYTSATNTIRSSQTCRFMAFPSGGTYAWYRKNAGATLWKGAGTTREISLSSGTASFQLKVTVTVSTASDTDSLSLNVTSTGALCNGY
jgi:hypothetical protein